MKQLGRLIASLLTVGVAGAFSTGPLEAQESFPPADRVLATDTSGGWVNVDFLVKEDPLSEAKRCVRSRPRAEAVACFAFTSRASYGAARPVSAGNFRQLCWEARWSRNKLNSQSGRESSYKPPTCPEREQMGEGPSDARSEVATPSKTDEGKNLRVEIEVAYRLDNARHLKIHGDTNLPDDTQLSLSVKGTGYMGQSDAVVNNGRYVSEWFSDGGRGLSPGRYEISVTVPFYNAQPAKVRDVLGDKMQKMTGPLVRWMDVRSLGKVANASRTITIQ